MEIHTLVGDIYDLLKRDDPLLFSGISPEIEGRIALQATGSNAGRRGTLRLSRLGLRCPRALWYEINHPELAEKLPPWAIFKYSYGHIIEALALHLAKLAGHSVEGVGDALELDGIRGHRDCVIDGAIVDVKSTSSRAFAKFKDGTLARNDSFGYLEQLDGYVVASVQDPLVHVKDKGYILAIDKQLGHMVIYEHKVRPDHIHERIKAYKQISESSEIPSCSCETVPDGASGNIKLGIQASYSAYKYCCRPELRCFLYADGPRYLTKVVRLPNVPELDRQGQVVYN